MLLDGFCKPAKISMDLFREGFVFNKKNVFTYLIYAGISIFLYVVFKDQQDGRRAMLWLVFAALIPVHFMGDIFNLIFKKNGWVVSLFMVVVMVSLGYLVLTTYIQLYVTETTSMVPTIYPGNVMVVNKMAYDTHQPQRNDIVLFHSENSVIPVIHRIVAVPGDLVMIDDEGKVMIEEDYSFSRSADKAAVYLYEGTYFQAGDNPNSESGIIERHQISGKIIHIFGGKPAEVGI